MSNNLFCGKNTIILSSSIRNEIKKKLNSIGTFNITAKYYSFLSKKNVNNLRDNTFSVSLRSFGKAFVLFIINVNNKNYCVFINKKNEFMNVVQLKFHKDLYNGTLFDGEIVKNENNKWIFLINDIAYYKGENLITQNFSKRQNILNNIIKNEFENIKNDNMLLSKKQFFEYKFIQDLVDTYMNNLNYKCSGLYFKNHNNFSDNYLFIFPECRSDTKILNNGVTIDNQKVRINDEKSPMKKSISKEDILLFGEIEDVTQNGDNEKPKLKTTTCKFLINPTELPDIYELYCIGSNNQIEKMTYACVPDLQTSNLLKEMVNTENMFETVSDKIKSKKANYVECNYHKEFKKWIPFKKCDSMDQISLINETQIILDSL
tara:strand:+ start:267 stop:1391 length:1125 start_codon:yes stop_codon:yes gene_type:complete